MGMKKNFLPEPKIFEHEQFGKVRFVMIENEMWFVATDVCKILDLSNVTKALYSLDEDEKNTLTISKGIPGNPNMNVVNESGLYHLIFQSRKPEARNFRKWVTSEVLPSIRKYGYYIAPHKEIISIEGRENYNRFRAKYPNAEVQSIIMQIEELDEDGNEDTHLIFNVALP